MPELPQRGARVRGAMLVASVIPMALCGALTYRYGFDAPYWDQWWHAPLISDALDGTVQLSDFWRSVNEHRVFFPNFLIVGLALATGWDIRFEHAAMLLMAVMIFAGIAVAIARDEKASGRDGSLWVLPVVSVLLFSYSMREIWTWGLHLIITTAALAAVASLVLVSDSRNSHARFLVGVVMAIVASFSFGSSLGIWAAGFAVLARGRLVSGIGNGRLAIWITVGLGTALIYVTGLQTDGLSIGEIARHPIAFGTYLLAYIGGPLAAHHGQAAVVVGALGLAIAAWFLTKSIRSPVAIEADGLALGLIVFGMTAGVLTGFKQFHEGPDQAISSRYLVWPTFLWIGIVVAAYGRTPWLSTMALPGRAVLALLLVAVSVSSAYGAYRADERYDAFALGRAALLEERYDEDIRFLYPDPDIPQRFRPLLVRHGLTVFDEAESVQN